MTVFPCRLSDERAILELGCSGPHPALETGLCGKVGDCKLPQLPDCPVASLPLLIHALHCWQFRHSASAQDTATVEAKLEELIALVPDVAGRLGRMKADVLMRLLSDTEVCFMGKLRICAVYRVQK